MALASRRSFPIAIKSRIDRLDHAICAERIVQERIDELRVASWILDQVIVVDFQDGHVSLSMQPSEQRIEMDRKGLSHSFAWGNVNIAVAQHGLL